MITSTEVHSGVKNVERNMRSVTIRGNYVGLVGSLGQTMAKSIQGGVEPVFLPLSLSTSALLTGSGGPII